MAMRVVECLSRLLHLCQGGVRDDSFCDDTNTNSPDTTNSAYTWINQDDGNTPAIVNGVELRLISRKAIW